MEKKILVVEDDPATSRLVDYALRHAGYQVITAANGLEGVRRAQKEGLPISPRDLHFSQTFFQEDSCLWSYTTFLCLFI